MKLYGAFTKVEEQDDGTIIVEGIASSESVDCDGEVVKASAIEAALPDYMRHGTGALREMHQPSAAGTATAAVEGDVTTIKAHVVDPVAVKKVTTGVYKGFSIGGKVTERDAVNKNTITGLRLVEISLVDRPANPDAVLTMWKAEVIDGDGQDAGEEATADLDAAQADDIAAAADDVVEQAEDTGDLHKGLWMAAELLQILSELTYLRDSAEWEAQVEADASPVPAKLRAAVDVLADVILEYTSEQVAEAQTAQDVDVVEMAAPVADLAKADEAESDLAKLAATIPDLIAKALAPVQAELDALKSQPAPAKAIVMAPVGKAEDAGQPAIEKVEPVLNPDGSVNEIATDLKKLHRAGGVISA